MNHDAHELESRYFARYSLIWLLWIKLPSYGGWGVQSHTTDSLVMAANLDAFSDIAHRQAS